MADNDNEATLHVNADVEPGKKGMKDLGKVVVDETKKIDAATKESGSAIEKVGEKVVKANRRVSEASKQKTAQVVADSKIQVKAADAEVKAIDLLIQKQKTSATRSVTKRSIQGSANRLEQSTAVAQGRLDLAEKTKNNKAAEAEDRRHTQAERAEQQKRNFDYMQSDRDRRRLEADSKTAREQDTRRVERIVKQSQVGSEEDRKKVLAAVQSPTAVLQRASLTRAGLTPHQALMSQLTPAVGRESSLFLTGAGPRTTQFGGKDADAAAQMRLGQEMSAMTNRYNADRVKGEREASKAAKLSENEQIGYWNSFYKQRAAGEKDLTKVAKIAENEQAQYWLKLYRDRAAGEKAVAKTTKAELKEVQTALSRAVQGSPELQAQLKAILTAPGAGAARAGMVAGGLLPQQARASQLQAGGIPAQIANFVGGIRGTKTPIALGGAAAPPGGINGLLRRLLGGGGGGVAGSIVGGLAGGLGVGLGGYAVAGAARAAIDAAKQATAYERQTVAARNLSGSQEQLNKLLQVYSESSGGAVSKTEALASVTRLLATGYAKTTGDMAKFVRATRGASIALGKDQEQVTQEIQLAISNTSVKRLDNIGLGIQEVNDRIRDLRKTNAGWTRENAFGQAVLGLLDEKYGKLNDTLEGQKTGLEKLASAWDDLTLAQGKNSKSAINRAAAGIAAAVQHVADTRPGQNFEGTFGSGYGRTLQQDSAFDRFVASIHGYDGNTTRYNAQQAIDKGTFQFTNRGDSPAGPYVNPGVSKGRFSGEGQYEAVSAGYDQVQQLEKEYNKARLAEIDSYELQRASIIENYGKQVVREEQDFARQRARGLRDYERSVVDIMRDAQERDSEIRSDLEKKISEDKEDSNKRLAKGEKKYQEEIEKSNKDHLLAMQSAAGQLDAIAILEERKSFAKEQKERKKNHEESVSDEKEALAERIQDAKDAAEERIKDAHDADAKRLADMQANRALQLADEDEDRKIQIDRAAEDHQDELDKLDAAHNLRLAQLEQEAEDNRKLLQDSLEKDLTAVGIYIEGYQEKLKARDELMEKWFDKYTKKLEDAIKLEAGTTSRENTVTGRNPDLPGYARGGFVGRTGPAMLHAGEFVMPHAMVQSAASMSNYSSSSSSRSIQIMQGAISVFTTPGMEHMVGDLVEEKMIELLGTV